MFRVIVKGPGIAGFFGNTAVHEVEDRDDVFTEDNGQLVVINVPAEAVPARPPSKGFPGTVGRAAHGHRTFIYAQGVWATYNIEEI